MANIVTFDQKKSQVKIKAFELNNEIVFRF